MKKIVKKFYKIVSFFDPISMGGGSGAGVKEKKLYYMCTCGKSVSPSRWKNHICGKTKNTS